MSVLEKEFFIEQFRRIHERFDEVNERFGHVKSEQQQMREEMSIIREQVGILVTDHHSVHNRLDLLQKRQEKTESRLGVDKPEH